MKLYLDTEFNGHGGALISMAFAPTEGAGWYGVIHEDGVWLEEHYHPWVWENVIPELFAIKPTVFGSRAVVRASLREYLVARQGCIIYADWPADFSHLMDMLVGPSHDKAFVFDIGMQLLKDSSPQPDFPHNAMSDAIALMQWHAAHGV